MDFTTTIRTLEQQRSELLDQVAAIDRAIAALTGADKPGRRPAAPPPRLETPVPATPAAPARKKRQFRLSEEHKQKLLEGQRRARESRNLVAAASDEGAPVIAGWKGDGPARLVKKEGTL
jgi:hypothetical protein